VRLTPLLTRFYLRRHGGFLDVTILYVYPGSAAASMKNGFAKYRNTLSGLLLACDLVATGGTTGLAAQNETGLSGQSDTNAIEMLRSNIQLQEQLHRIQLSIEENRRQTEAAQQANAQSIGNRLQLLEKSLANERARDIDAVRSSTRVIWVVACTFGIVGFLAMVLMGYQWRTVSHLAEAVMPSDSGLRPGNALTTFGNDDTHLLANGSAERSNAQLLSAIALLEKRIQGLEQTGVSAVKVSPPAGSYASPLALASSAESILEPTQVAAQNDRIDLLLGKGQSLLNMDKAEEALGCFEQALATEPAHPDALLKKAAALERLRKLPEAIECYDQAIAADGALTIAYLHEGGLFNRMERYEEALECYEQALKAQEKR